MALANDSILVTPGSGATIPSHAVASKEYEALVAADYQGHVTTSRPVYQFQPSFTQTFVGNNVLMWDLFNADASLIVRVRSIAVLVDAINTSTNGPHVQDWTLRRTTAVGTGGTALTAILPDTSQTALDADITCRNQPSGGATSSTLLLEGYTVFGAGRVPVIINSVLGAGSYVDLVPESIGLGTGIVLRQNQGLRLEFITGNLSGDLSQSGLWNIIFDVE